MGERHPIPDRPLLPMDERVAHVECYLGRLWDQVWWLSLPWYRKVYYWCCGWRAPIRMGILTSEFYEQESR